MALMQFSTSLYPSFISNSSISRFHELHHRPSICKSALLKYKVFPPRLATNRSVPFRSTDPTCASAADTGLPDEIESPIRDLNLIALSMTAGNDVLFPGCCQSLTIDEVTAKRVIAEIAELEPPEFGYITLNAWGDPAPVGTVAVIEDLKYKPTENSALICNGIARFRVLSISNNMTRARVEIFNDEIPVDNQLDHIIQLEQQLVTALRDIVKLTIKISDDGDTHQHALEDILKRVESFCEENNDEVPAHWIMKLGPDLRRELLSFLVVDMLSVSFMDRRGILESTDTAERLDAALKGLEPFVRELAAKGAIVGALGKDTPEFPGDSSSSSQP